MSPIDPDEQRATSRDSWERAAAGWGRFADRIRDWGIGVSAAMIDSVALGPGQRVLELAAGPGDTGFMAAELVAPGGTVICSDGAEAMVELARARAAAQDVRNVEFRVLELEWIDLPTADVDAVLCRWGLMLVVDPETAAREIRRVLRPGGATALAVWDVAERNPWATIPAQTMIDLGHAPPADPDEPGMFTLAADGVLRELLQSAGLIDVSTTAVVMERRFASIDQYLAETLGVSSRFRASYVDLDFDQQQAVRRRIAHDAQAYTAADGSLALPGSSLVATAGA